MEAVLSFVDQWFNAPVALCMGLLLASTFGNPYVVQTRKISQYLLMISVAGLGGGMNLNSVIAAGTSGFIYTAVTLILTFACGLSLGRLLKTSRDTSILITVGTAICGGSAIASAAAAIRAKSEDISVSLATVFCLNAVALLIFPFFGHLMGFDQSQFGLWSALAVHDTSSVVGTSLQYGEVAIKVGTTVKLARALWIVPVTLMVARFTSSKERPKMPWFILGFIAMAALVTWVPEAKPVGEIVSFISKKLLIITLFLIGWNLNKETIKAAGVKAILQGVILWIIVSLGTAAAICANWIRI